MLDFKKLPLDAQLTALLDGETTPEQKHELEQRLATDDGARRIYDKLRNGADFGKRRLDSWVYTLMRQQWSEDHRKRKPHAVNKTNVTDIRTATRDRAAIIDSDAIHRMIAEMPEGIASAFLLVSIEGHGYQQAGDIIGVAPTLIMSQLAQAKLHFASLADDHSHRF